MLRGNSRYRPSSPHLVKVRRLAGNNTTNTDGIGRNLMGSLPSLSLLPVPIGHNSNFPLYNNGEQYLSQQSVMPTKRPQSSEKPSKETGREKRKGSSPVERKISRDSNNNSEMKPERRSNKSTSNSDASSLDEYNTKMNLYKKKSEKPPERSSIILENDKITMPRQYVRSISKMFEEKSSSQKSPTPSSSSSNQTAKKSSYENDTISRRAKVVPKSTTQKRNSFNYAQKAAPPVTITISVAEDVPVQKQPHQNRVDLSKNSATQSKSNKKKPVPLQQSISLNLSEKEKQTEHRRSDSSLAKSSRRSRETNEKTKKTALNKDVEIDKSKKYHKRTSTTRESLKNLKFDPEENVAVMVQPVRPSTPRNTRKLDLSVPKKDPKIRLSTGEFLDIDDMSENEELPKPPQDIEQYRNKTIDGIYERFMSISEDLDIADNYSEADWNDMENYIKEIEEEVQTLIKQKKESIATAKKSLLKPTPQDEEALHDEKVTFTLPENNSFSEEDDFGKCPLHSEDNSYLEAFNKPGYELMETQVAEIVYKIEEDSDSSSDGHDTSSLNCYDNTLYYLPPVLDDLVEVKLHNSEEEVEKNDNQLIVKVEDGYSDYSNQASPTVERRSSLIYNFRRTETIYDDQQNPIIEKVSALKDVDTKIDRKMSETSFDVRQPLGTKIMLIMKELVETEEKYVNHLKYVLKAYRPRIDNLIDPHLIGKGSRIFGNLHKIYDKHLSFYNTLKLCENHEEIADAFIGFGRIFELYPTYAKNKPKADSYIMGSFKEVIRDIQTSLGDKLGLSSYLLSPIQRLGKYILLLEKIKKELDINGASSYGIEESIRIVRSQMTRANDLIAIESINECPFSIIEQGSFVMRETFNVLKPKKQELTLFLFENIVIFTIADLKNPEKFFYKDSIRLDEMGIVMTDDDCLEFHLKRFPAKKDPKNVNLYVIEAKKKTDKVKWTKEIERRLWMQLEKCKEQQRKLNSEQGVRNSVRDLPKSPVKRQPTPNKNERKEEKTNSIFYLTKSLENLL